MGFRFNKRVNLGGGFGLNVSKSGISPSLRTKYGTISNKRVSVRNGIKGVTYQKTIGRSKNSGCMILIILFISITVILCL